MSLDPETVVTLVAQLEQEYESLEKNFVLNDQAWGRIRQGADHPLDWAALGYTLHTIYTAMENYFLLVSKAFENNLSSDSWHKELLKKMKLELPGIRPRVLDSELTRKIDELRGFRHVFRSLYDDRLDPERISLIQKKIPDIRAGFSSSHQRFCRAVQELTLR